LTRKIREGVAHIGIDLAKLIFKLVDEPLVPLSSRRVTWSQGGRILVALLSVAAGAFVVSALLIEAMEAPDNTEEGGGLVKVLISDRVLCLLKGFGWALACALGRALERCLELSDEELWSTVSCSIFLQRIILNGRTDGEEERWEKKVGIISDAENETAAELETNWLRTEEAKKVRLRWGEWHRSII
jgi:hypothetical protein